MRRRCPPAPNGQNGMVLVAALLVMALLAVLSIAGISASSLEVKISGHDRASKQAFYLCEAGLEKAKYDVQNSWGKGADSGGGGPPYTFAFTDDTMPAAAKAWWAQNKWIGFTFVDAGGAEFQIQGNSLGAPYQVTLGLPVGATANAPRSGRARIYYANPGEIATVTWTSATMTQDVAGNPWPGIASLRGYYLVDKATGTFFSIDSSTSGPSSLTVGGATVPTAGTAYTICSAWSAAATSIFLAPGLPNPDWTTTPDYFLDNVWYLIDADRKVFRITGHSQSATYSGAVLTLAGDPGATPKNGPFQLTTSPWLADLATQASPYVTYSATSGSTDFQPPGHPDPANPSATVYSDYGTVRVTVTHVAGGRLRLTAEANSGSAGDSRSVSQDARLALGGTVQFLNWREGNQ